MCFCVCVCVCVCVYMCLNGSVCVCPENKNIHNSAKFNWKLPKEAHPKLSTQVDYPKFGHHKRVTKWGLFKVGYPIGQPQVFGIILNVVSQSGGTSNGGDPKRVISKWSHLMGDHYNWGNPSCVNQKEGHAREDNFKVGHPKLVHLKLVTLIWSSLWFTHMGNLKDGHLMWATCGSTQI